MSLNPRNVPGTGAGGPIGHAPLIRTASGPRPGPGRGEWAPPPV